MRVNLARSLYRDADVYFLDDPLASLDSAIAATIYENLFHPLNGFLIKKSVFFVTNNTSLLSSMNFLYFLKEGSVGMTLKPFSI